MQERQTLIETKMGKIFISAEETGISAVSWSKRNVTFVNEKRDKTQFQHLNKGKKQIEEFFAGKRKVFDIPLIFNGTAFQKRVWKALRKIPFGEVWSYSDIAKEIGSPSSTRAIGSANAKNPIALIVPCHRVIRKSGELSGYAGGVKRKEQLLSFEGHNFS